MQLHKRGMVLAYWFLMAFCAMIFVAHADENEEKVSSSISDQWDGTEIKHLIARMEWAASQTDYSGRYVISQADAMNTLETIHTLIDHNVHELTTTLSGDKIAMYRDDEDLYSINAHQRSVLYDPQTMVQLFPSWGKPGYGDSQWYYKLQQLGTERYIDREADVIKVLSEDDWRFGYEVWIDRETGLLLRIEIHDVNEKTLQRLFFTEINIENIAETEKSKLFNYIKTLQSQGFKINEWPFSYVSAIDEGWEMAGELHGFVPIACVKRPLEGQMHELLQWIFTDGVAGVSIFIEPAPKKDLVLSATLPTSGATNGIVYGLDDWKITIVGEVPVKTLENFATLLQKANITQELVNR